MWFGPFAIDKRNQKKKRDDWYFLEEKLKEDKDGLYLYMRIKEKKDGLYLHEYEVDDQLNEEHGKQSESKLMSCSENLYTKQLLKYLTNKNKY